jgi:hypothetical protein
MGTTSIERPQPGRKMRVVQTGQVGRVKAVDSDWERLFPHKGVMLVLEIESDRCCYSQCELEPCTEEEPSARPA